MVRRRCRYIVCLMAAAMLNTTMKTWVMRYARPHRHEIPSTSCRRIPHREKQEPFRRGGNPLKEIDPTLENGYLVYIKPVVLAGDDSDVAAYKAANPVFPHESTGNQWFNESQTESYRMLGVRSVLDTFKQPWNPQQKFEGVIRAASPQKDGAMGATAESAQAASA